MAQRSLQKLSLIRRKTYCLGYSYLFRNSMVFWSPKSSTIQDFVADDDCLHHNFQAGDHVLRWTNLLIYPIQIHGIILVASTGIVTIIDFGLSSANENHSEELSKEFRDRPLNIITLTEQKEVDQWKRVNYGESLLPDGKWARILSWFRKKEDSCVLPDEKSALPDSNGKRSKDIDSLVSNSNVQATKPPPPKDLFLQNKDTEELLAWIHEEDTVLSTNDGDDNSISVKNSLQPSTGRDESVLSDIMSNDTESPGYESLTSKEGNMKTASSPSIPKSDPPGIVLSRVRFLLSEAGRRALPPHNLLYSNSECMAVWCKTGRFSTIQSQIFLHSTALGNAKTATTVALMVSAQTVTVTSTVPAAGFWGWLGYTTTTTSQVGLLSLNPWLIPVLVGYGIAAVGTPYLILHNAQGKWEKATLELNDSFWQSASHDVFVDALHHWSGLGSTRKPPYIKAIPHIKAISPYYGG